MIAEIALIILVPINPIQTIPPTCATSTIVAVMPEQPGTIQKVNRLRNVVNVIVTPKQGYSFPFGPYSYSYSVHIKYPLACKKWILPIFLEK